jgi:hypothetical protein
LDVMLKHVVFFLCDIMTYHKWDILTNIVFLRKLFTRLKFSEIKYLPGISRRRSFKNRLFVCKRIKRRISTGHVLKSVFPL